MLRAKTRPLAQASKLQVAHFTFLWLISSGLKQSLVISDDSASLMLSNSAFRFGYTRSIVLCFGGMIIFCCFPVELYAGVFKSDHVPNSECRMLGC